MKAICRPSNHKDKDICLYLFSDETQVDIQEGRMVVGHPLEPDFIVLDCFQSNAVLYENVTTPSGWTGWKYKYSSIVTSGTEEKSWVLNDQWQDPNA
tara:strand:- start:132 stop:422 length:291 start_codon:yes stop_codon:yes gene_type:complete